MPSATVRELASDLRRLGVSPRGIVMVHASLRKIGPVEGRAEGVIQALEAAVGAEGTVLMTLGALDPMGWVGGLPESERAGALAGSEPFDHMLTPADPDVGALAEVFRRLPGTVAQDHPEGRFAARGRLAVQLLSDTPWNDYYGPGSSLERLVENRGQILRLGADLDTVTALHYAEYLSAVPNKRRVRRHRMVKGTAGPEVRAIECLDDSDGIVDYPGEDYFAAILSAYLRSGRARTGKVGLADSELLDAADIVRFGADWMNEHLGAGKRD